jgi:hypothetical protein
LAVSSRAELSAEVLFLRKQLAFYQEHLVQPRQLTDAARFSLMLWSQLFNWRAALVIVKPETLIGWHSSCGWKVTVYVSVARESCTFYVRMDFLRSTTVLDDKDHAVPNATVVCAPAQSAASVEIFPGRTRPINRAISTCCGLNPGGYTILAWEKLEDDYRDPEFLKSNEAHGQIIRLDEGDRKSISLKVIPASSDEP